MPVLGVDGCPGGWVGALVEDRELTWHAGSFAELLRLGADVVAVDIPIGLPAGVDRRAADFQARQLLGPQRSSVFFTPPRVVLEAGSQPEATRLSRAAGSVGVSIQTFHILTKVAEVDLAVRGGAPQVVEVHPEVSFRRLAQLRTDPDAELPQVFPDAVSLAGKRTAQGQRQRLDLLRSWLPGLSLPVPRPGRAAVDDCLDAAVCAWSAARWSAGRADVLGGEGGPGGPGGEVDELGVPMRIVV